MQEDGVFNLKTEIKKNWKNNPTRLLRTIRSQLENEDSFTKAEILLREIIDNHKVEFEYDTRRKQLSRQIGEAKRNNSEYTQLIQQVSNISSDIIVLKKGREQSLDYLETLLEKSKFTTTGGPTHPRHFSVTPSHNPGESFSSNRYNIENNTIHHEWRTFTDSCDRANIYHDIRWHQLLERNFGHQTYSLGFRDNEGKLTGIMPLTHVQSRLFGSFTVSMPYFNYGGPLATDATAEYLLMKHAAQLSETLGCGHMEARETEPRTGWLCSQKKVSMILPLPRTNQELDHRLGSKLRAQVNRAANHGLTAKIGGVELVDAFYSVYSHNMRDLGTPAYKAEFFKDIANTFTSEFFIAVVQRDNKVVAAGFMLGYRDKLEIPWASSLRRFNHTNANMLLYRSVLSEAINRGFTFFDFGRSTRGASTYKFKKQWGAKEHPLYWHYWTHDGKLPQLNPDNPKYRLAIAGWKRLPVTVSRIIGPLISRNLP